MQIPLEVVDPKWANMYELQKCREIIDLVNSQEKPTFWHLFYKARSLTNLGQFNNSLELIDEIQKHANPVYKPIINFMLAINYRLMGDLRKEGELFDKCYNQALKLDLKNSYFEEIFVSVLTSYAETCYTLGQVKKAIGITKQSMGIANTINSPTFQKLINEAWNRNLLAILDRDQGNLDLAVKNAKLSVDLIRLKARNEKIDNMYGEGTFLDTLATIYWDLGEKSKAIEKLSEAIEISERASSQDQKNQVLWYHSSESLARLIDYYLQTDKFDLANRCYEKLEAFQTEKNLFSTTNFTKLSKALILKYSSRGSDKYQAQNLFREIFEDPNITVNRFYNDYLYHFIDLLLQEYEHYGNEVVLKEIQEWNQLMIQWSEDTPGWMRFNALMLKSKLALINGDIEQSEKILDVVITDAETNGFNSIIKRALNEKELIVKNMNTWQKLAQKNVKMAERVKQADLKEYLSYALKINEEKKFDL